VAAVSQHHVGLERVCGSLPLVRSGIQRLRASSAGDVAGIWALVHHVLDPVTRCLGLHSRVCQGSIQVDFIYHSDHKILNIYILRIHKSGNPALCNPNLKASARFYALSVQQSLLLHCSDGEVALNFSEDL